MDVLISGKNTEVPANAREYIQKKIGKLDHHLPEIKEAKVEISKEQTRSKENRIVVEVTVNCQGTLLRGEERAADVFAAIDSVTDIMNKQIRRFKGRADAKKRRSSVLRDGLKHESVTEPADEEENEIVVKSKRFPLIPMTVADAIHQMELLGHDFFVFFEIESKKVDVVYRRKDGDYGLLEPDTD